MNRDIIAEIDAVTGCQYPPCGRQLDDSSPSADFCSAEHQAAWLAARTVPLDEYTEPEDLSVHVGNLVELHSAETCSLCVEGAPAAHRFLPDSMWRQIAARAAAARRATSYHDYDGDTVRVRPTTTSFDTAMRRALNSAASRPGRSLEVSNAFGPLTEWEQQLVDGVPDYTWTPADPPAEPWVPDHVWNSARYDGRTPDASGRVALAFDGGRNAEMPLAHFLVDEDGTVRAHGITDARPVGVDPSGDVVIRIEPDLWQWHAVRDRLAERAEEISRAMAPLFVDLAHAASDATAALAPLVDALRQDDTPPAEPRARALWLRQRRNTGPRPSQHRAPRAINPRRTR